MSDNKNYILEVRVEHRDGRAKYARSGHCGYTNNLEDAGRFTKKEAEDYVIGQESKYEAKPFTSPPTVTISRECADYLKDTLNWVEESGIGDWGSLDAKRLSELTKAMEVKGE